MSKMFESNRTWLYMPMFSLLMRLRNDNYRFKTSLGYIVRTLSQNQQHKNRNAWDQKFQILKYLCM